MDLSVRRTRAPRGPLNRSTRTAGLTGMTFRAGDAAQGAGWTGDPMKRFGGPITPFGGPNASPGDNDEYALWDAAYVLGSLPSAERSEYQAHLKTCPSCRQAVAELSCMPALLSRLDGEDVAAIDEGGPKGSVPPLRPQVLNSLQAKVSHRRLGGPGTPAELEAAWRTRWRHFSAMTKFLVQSWHGDS